MRFLDQISRKVVLTEAGIADAGVLLDRLIMELQACSKYVVSAQVPSTGSIYNDIQSAVTKTEGAKELILPDLSDQYKNQALNYNQAMWLSKMIRLEMVVLVDRLLPHTESENVPDGWEKVSQRGPNGWTKYAERVYRDAGIRPEQWKKEMAIMAGNLAPGSIKMDRWLHWGNMCRVSPDVAAIPWVGLNPVALASKLETAESAWQAKRPAKEIFVNNRDQVLITDDEIGEKGWFWVYLKRGHCSEEAKAMGHCGSSGGHLISLRQVLEYDDKGKPFSWRPWATASYNPQTKTIGELKGPENSKLGVMDAARPGAQERNRIVRKAIAALFRWGGVHGFQKSTYKAHLDFRPDDLDDENFDSLPNDRPGLYHGSAKSWAKKFGTGIDSLKKFLEHERYPSLTDEILLRFDKDAARALLENNKWTNDEGHEFKAGVSAGPAGYVHAYGQTKIAVDLYLQKNSYMTDDGISALKGAALKRAFERRPTEFKVGNYIRAQRALGNKDDVVELFQKYQNRDGKKWPIYPREIEMLSPADRKKLFKSNPEAFDGNLYLRTFGSKDPIVNDLIKEIDSNISDETLKEMSTEARAAIIGELITHAPAALVRTFGQTLQEWNPDAKLFVWKIFSNPFEMVTDGSLNQGRRGSDNAMEWMAGIAAEGFDHNNDDDKPYGSVQHWVGEFIKGDARDAFIDYVEREYPERTNEVGNWEDALDVIEDEDDAVFEALRHGWSDGSSSGRVDDITETFWRQLRGYDGKVFDIFPIDISYCDDGKWDAKPSYDTKVHVGFSPQTLIKMIKDNDCLEALMEDKLERDRGGFFYYDQGGFGGFNRENAFDNFLEMCPDEQLEKDIRERSKNVKESLADRLNW